MTKQVWFITGAGRGLGVDIAKAALAAGHAVVASGRDTKEVEKALGRANDLLVVQLDVTRLSDAEAAARAAVQKFGRIDVLVNNAGNFYAGFFEELSPQDMEKQIAVNLIGPMNVTRAILPVMRKQRSGRIVTISSSGGIVGGEFQSAYSATKFGVEGWMESLAPEVAPFGIETTLVNPGVFRTQLLSEKSMLFASLSIPEYKERREKLQSGWSSFSGNQPGDPKKLAAALVKLMGQEKPPRRFVAGADAVAAVKKKAADLVAQTDAYLELSTSLAHE
jgi:NAD(P)-dependent dehydrogenase (short-subunit alcohol dehydrogenase family)